MNNIEIQKNIEAYVMGLNDPEEIDNLWIEILKEPEWHNYLIAHIGLTIPVQ